jgi:hypothetical protein
VAQASAFVHFSEHKTSRPQALSQDFHLHPVDEAVMVWKKNNNNNINKKTATTTNYTYDLSHHVTQNKTDYEVISFHSLSICDGVYYKKEDRA